ncbi:hypothetical protein [Dyadobacter psychrotolerans]|uniref:Uncharacterized protein n=1 Tax=Dyadobacter psychrotolerans TaxID=2541721 RepID=A0A4R5DJ49_9BACT|nr:hypothetical protein [Dyadobacter psychrotolerans]TDE11974.1 hypothetical protein E0F88_23245 [Dyadobacter psychrotolerans]
MNGTVGRIEGTCFNQDEFFISAGNLTEVDSVSLRRYFRIFKDSVNTEGGCEGTQSGAMYCLQIIPGTATKGKIEVEFREYGYGF